MAVSQKYYFGDCRDRNIAVLEEVQWCDIANLQMRMNANSDVEIGQSCVIVHVLRGGNRSLQVFRGGKVGRYHR